MRSKILIVTAGMAVAGLMVAACSTTPEERINATPGQAPAVEAAPLPAQVTTTTAALMDIVDTAVAAGDFTTLAQALTAAGLVETLKGPGPFTVFAPTDAAFAKVPAATLQALLADKEALTKVLTYHVVPGEVLAADVRPGNVTTVEGSPIAVTVEGTTVKLNGTTTVTAVDVQASNGVIHVIDSVLLPPDLALPSTL